MDMAEGFLEVDRITHRKGHLPIHTMSSGIDFVALGTQFTDFYYQTFDSDRTQLANLYVGHIDGGCSGLTNSASRAC